MKLKITLFLLIAFSLNAYNQSITGKVLDPNKEPLELATCAVIDPADSTLISYANTNKEGVFIVDNLIPGKAIFQIHFVGFSTYQKEITFTDKAIDLGEIILDQGLELENVTVVGVIPVKVKQDTIAYNTKAFKVRVDDNVEDLLKKLPGVEVDASGKVTAQGEEVSKVYVDGKEFFGGDVTTATKNLSADAVKSVEIIDEKSDKARLTGINDAQRSKVLNLKLKEEKKTSDFGKFQGGYGTDDRYSTNFSYNRFSPKTQISVIGRLNNINSNGSDITEVISFSSIGGRGGMFSRGESASSNGFYTTGMIGGNLGYEFKKDQNLNVDYNYNYTDFNSGQVKTDRTEFINDLNTNTIRQINSHSESKSTNINNSNRLNFGYRDRSNDKGFLWINGNFNFSNSKSSSLDSLAKDDGFGNANLQSSGSTSSDNNNGSGNVMVRYTRRFSETSKRNLSLWANIGANTSESTSTNTQRNIFNISTVADTTLFESTKKSTTTGITGQLNLEYNEPITDVHFVSATLKSNFSVNKDDVDQANYSDGLATSPLIYKYDKNDLDMKYGLGYLYNKESFSLGFGAEFNQVNLNLDLQDQINGDQNLSRVYKMVNPTFYIMNRPGRGKFMRFQLERSMIVPSANQLSPVVNNFNPLFITQGNTNLDPETSYSANFMWGNFNFESGNTYHVSLNASYNQNSIINSETTDLQTNIRTTTYLNKGDRKSASTRFMFGRRVASWGIRFNTGANASYSDYLTLINNLENQTQTKTIGGNLSVENNEKGKFDINVGGNWSWNFTSFTNGNNADRQYFQQSYYARADWNITERLNLNSQFTYSLYTDSNFGTDISAPIWNAGISYAMLASKRLTLGINAMDILNRNIGVSQSSGDNYFQETQRDVLSNYYMFTLTYNLNNMIEGQKSRSSRSFRMRRL